MITQKPLDALQRWRTASLANTFALHAAFMSVASIVVVALMSLAVIYTTERSSLHERLRDKSVRVAERTEAAIGVVEDSVTALSNNPMFMTAARRCVNWSLCRMGTMPGRSTTASCLAIPGLSKAWL